MNLDRWNGFSPDLQKFFLEQFDKFEDKMWQTGKEALDNADFCNFGTGACPEGTPAKLIKVEVSAADQALHKKLMNEVVLVEWGKRAGVDYAKEWNATIGKVVGLTIPLDKL